MPIYIVVSAGGQEKIAPKSQQFGKNENFSGSDKNIWAISETFGQ